MTDYFEHNYEVYKINHFLSVRVYNNNRVELAIKSVGSVVLNQAELQKLRYTLHKIKGGN